MRKVRKNWVQKLVIIGALLAFLFTGAAHAAEIRQISIAGAGTAGTFYIMASGFADLFSRYLNIPSIPEVTAGSVENARLLDTRRVEMGVIQLDVMQDALEGNNDTFRSPVEISALVPMFPNIVQLITLKDSPIASFADLRGRRVSVGSPGSGILATNRVLLSAMGLSMEDIQPLYLSFVETTNAFRDGQIDAALVNTAAPAPWLVDLETTHSIKLIPFSDAEIERLTTEFPSFAPFSLAKDTYNSLDEDINTLALWITLATFDSLPEQLAYDATKLIFENTETLKTVHSAATYILPENARFISVPFHPGAARYLREKGIDVGVK